MMIEKPPLERKLDRLREPFRAFFAAQATASGCLLLALAAAMLAANSPLAADYLALRHVELFESFR
jgi:Na+/H+ antiporter NhaA